MGGWAQKHVPRAWRSPATCEARGAADDPHGQPGPREVAGDPAPAPLNAQGKWVMSGVLLSSSPFANLPLPILLGKVFIKKKKILPAWLCCHSWNQDSHNWLYHRSIPTLHFASTHFLCLLLYQVLCGLLPLFLGLSHPLFLEDIVPYFSLLSLLRWGTMGRWEQRKTRHSGEKCVKYAQGITQSLF